MLGIGGTATIAAQKKRATRLQCGGEQVCHFQQGSQMGIQRSDNATRLLQPSVEKLQITFPTHTATIPEKRKSPNDLMDKP